MRLVSLPTDNNTTQIYCMDYVYFIFFSIKILEGFVFHKPH